MTPSRTCLHVASTFHIDSFLLPLISFMAPQVCSRCLHLSEGRSDISTVYILHRNRHLRPTLTTRAGPPGAGPMLLSSRATFVEWKGLSRPQIHRFRIRSRRGKHEHESLILAWRSLGKIKQRQMTSPSKDGAPDKDLSMVRFNGTEGEKEIKRFWEEVQERSPRKTPAGQTASPNQTCSTIAGCPERNSENGADSSSEVLSKPLPPPPSLHPPKKSKTFLRVPICLAEAQTEPRWHSPMLMILGIRIYKNTGWKESFHQGRILRWWSHKFKQKVEISTDA